MTGSVFVCVVLAVVGCLTVTSDAAQTARSPTLASNQAAASSDAANLLGEVALPAGAQQLSTEPAGDDGYLKPLAHLLATTIGVTDSGWWQVSGLTPQQVITEVSASPPPGVSSTGTSGSTGPDGSATGVTFWFADVPGVLDGREVQVTATVLPGGSTGVLVESQSVWVVPRTAASMIPARTRVISISETTRRGRVLRSRTVTRASRVRTAVAYFNALESVQPFVTSCPAEFIPPDVVTVRFLAGKHATPLATASFTGDFGQSGSGSSGPCNAVSLRVGAARAALLASTYVSSLNRLLGTGIP